MKQAYIDLYGSEPVLDADTPDAGWLWLKRFAQNGPIPQPGGDEVDSAFATPGMKDSLLAFHLVLELSRCSGWQPGF